MSPLSRYLEDEQRRYQMISIRITQTQKEINRLEGLEEDEINLAAREDLKLAVSRAALIQLRLIQRHTADHIRRLYARIRMYDYG